MVQSSVFLGDCIQVILRLPGGEEAVAQIARHEAAFQPGESVFLCWNRADEMSFA